MALYPQGLHGSCYKSRVFNVTGRTHVDNVIQERTLQKPMKPGGNLLFLHFFFAFINFSLYVANNGSRFVATILI